MEPPVSRMNIAPGINMNKCGTGGTSFNLIHCDSTNVCAESVCYSVPITSGCVQSLYKFFQVSMHPSYAMQVIQ